MSQQSIAAFFNTRKRAAGDDASHIKNKRLLESTEPSEQDNVGTPTNTDQSKEDAAHLKELTAVRTRSGRLVKRIGLQSSVSIEQQKKLVQFIKKGPLSPRKKPKTPSRSEIQKLNEQTPTTHVANNVDDSDNNSTAVTLTSAFASKDNVSNIERGLKTPTKQIIRDTTPLKRGVELKSLVRKELNFDDVKTKVTRSAKLQELKASLTRIKQLEQTRKAQEERNRRIREGIATPPKEAGANNSSVVQLQQFDKIELEVLTSPAKTFKTPTKLPPPTPDKNELMSPRHTKISKRVLFSPAKQGSPSKLIVPPAYQRFISLAESTAAPGSKLLLPYKYRHLIELFKALDSVCAMFHNRKECITFKKLKPAVQRMLRKNFTEMHLAQIKQVYPDAYIFSQMKMRNYGSTSKADYFQLVIAPNVAGVDVQATQKIDEDNVLSSAQSNSMNPQVMTERLQHFQAALLQRVKDEHDEFLKSLDPPLIIPKDKVTRWHPDFDLERCPDVELAHLPQPPNVEKYSSARDILSTARNLFNCATPLERVMRRYEAKLEAEREEQSAENVEVGTPTRTTAPTTPTTSKETPRVEGKTTSATAVVGTPATAATPTTDPASVLLKGVPKSLLERIRAKQAAKALDAMTRRPSQDEEATMYSRLPELARHLRNVFITERKSVLMLELIIKKIQNSFRTCLTPQEIEAHLKLMAKAVPTWAGFHEVRKTMYLKINKNMDLTEIVQKLETIANEKSK